MGCVLSERAVGKNEKLKREGKPFFFKADGTESGEFFASIKGL